MSMAKTIGYSTPIREKFGERIRYLRKTQNKKIEDIAFGASISTSYLGMIERGERNISIDMIERLAKSFKIKLVDLFDF